MHARRPTPVHSCGSLLIAFAALLLGAAGAALASPDLIVGELNGITKFATEGGITSYGIGPTSCNLGDVPALVHATSPQHPVVATNVYRIESGRFEQIGMSWLFHEYCALSGTTCSVCTPGQTCFELGAGCSTADTPFVTGQQVALGPRSDVHATSGTFLFPATSPSYSGFIARRLQIANADLDPAAHPGAVYIAEQEVISADDAAAGNGANNLSYRRVLVGSLQGDGYTLTFSGQTTRELPALDAWRALDPAVSLATVDIPSDGRFILASRCSDNGDGSWHYEYALLNINSDRAAASFSIPLPAGAIATNVAFHDVNYHSGEIYDTADWTSSSRGGAVSWSTIAFAINPNANALRWGTTYSYRFDANVPPGTVTATIGLFNPGSPSSATVNVCGPASFAPADLNHDGHVNGLDLAMLLAAWGNCPLDCICCCPSDLNCDGNTNGLDLAMLLAAWTG